MSNAQAIFNILQEYASDESLTVEDIAHEFVDIFGLLHDHGKGELCIEFEYNEGNEYMRYICISYYDENGVEVKLRKYDKEDIRDGFHFDFLNDCV